MSRRSATTCGPALVLATLLSLSSAAEAQPDTAADGERAASEEAVAPVAIPVSSVAVQASNLQALLRSVEAGLAVPEAQQRIAERLPMMEEEVQHRARRLEEDLAKGHQRGDLAASRASWLSILADLSRWESELEARLAALDRNRRELERRAAIWQETARVAEEERAPATIRDEIARAQRSLRALQQKLRRSRDAALGLQRGVVGLRTDAIAQLDAIERAREQALRQVFRRSQEPIWVLGRGDVEANRESFQRALGESRSALAAYASKKAPLLLFHALLTLGLVVGSTRARRGVELRAGGSGAELPPALRHPVAAGLLLGLTATLWLHPDAPPQLGRISVLLGLPFWFIVLRQLLPGALRAPLIGLLVLTPIDLARQLAFDFDVVARLLLLLESLILFVGILWLRRPTRLGAVPRTATRFWMRVLSGWLHLSLFASGIALLAAVTGWTTLAELLTATVGQGSFTGSVLFAAVGVLEGVTETAVNAGQLRGIRVIDRNRVDFLRILRRGVRAFATFTWLSLVLDDLGLRQPVLDSLSWLMATPMGYGNVQITLGGLVAFGVTLWLTWLLSRFLAVVLDREVFSRVALPRGVPFALSTVGRYVVLVLGFLAAVAALGVEVGNLTLLVSALGVGIGFGMQNIVNNFISGLILLFERPIKVGDTVTLPGLFGEVRRIGIRASVIRTFEGAEVIVPNGDLISNQVTNWTLSDTRRRVALPVGVVYGTPAERVIELLTEVAKADPEVLQDPAPYALFTGFGDSSLDFELRYWSDSPDALTLVRSGLAVTIQRALAEAGIEVPFPQRDLHLKSLPAEWRGDRRSESD